MALRTSTRPIMSIIDTFSQRLFFHLIESFPGSRDYGRTELTQLPYAVGHNLSRKLERQALHEFDTSTLSNSRWYNFEEPEVQRAREVLRLALVQHARFPKDTWEEELRLSADAITRFALSPIATLSSRLSHASFEDAGQDALINEVKNYSAYPLFLNETESWIRGGHIRSWTVDYPKLIREEIASWASHNSPNDWTVLVRPLYDLADEMGDAEIDIHLIEYLFDDLGLTSYFERIKRHAAMNNLTKIDIDGYVDALAESIPEAEEEFAFPNINNESADIGQVDEAKADATRVATEAPDLFAQVELDDTSEPELEVQLEEEPALEARAEEQPVPAPAADRDPAEPEPIWKKFQEKLNAPLARTTAEKKPQQTASEFAQKEPELSNDEKLNNPLWETFRDDSEKVKAEVLLEAAQDNYLMGSLEQTTRSRFVDELFNGEEKEFTTVVQKLNEVSTWNEASQIIADEIFRKNRVNIYSEAAVDFTNIIEKRLRK